MNSRSNSKPRPPFFTNGGARLSSQIHPHQNPSQAQINERSITPYTPLNPNRFTDGGAPISSQIQPHQNPSQAQINERSITPYHPLNPNRFTDGGAPISSQIQPRQNPSQAQINERSITPYPPLNPKRRRSSVLIPKDAVPLPQLFSIADDENLLSEHCAAAQLVLLSYSEKLRFAAAAAAAAAAGVVGSSTAIVPVDPSPDAAELAMARKKKKKKKKKYSRSGEMVRVSPADVRELVTSRDLVRRTRITYESLRSLLSGAIEESRPDVQAGVLMRKRRLLLNRDKRIIGTIPGIDVGDIFFYRMELCVLGLHGHLQAGIDYVAASQSTSGVPIATSIVVSGGYEDDEDRGDVLIYTGQGGREKNLTKQSVDQHLARGNLALERSMNYGIEIRVIRGLKCDRSPSDKVYVYDGLYKIIECWNDVGKSGFSVFKYKLVRLADQVEMGSVILKFAEELKRSPIEARPTRCLIADISVPRENFTKNQQERFPVPVFNDIDEDAAPMDFAYFASPVYTATALGERRLHGGGLGCMCVANCSAGCYCAKRNGGELPYDGNGILLKGKQLIYECGPFCMCPPSCPNRVSQKGLRNRLEVFRSLQTGWGVRSLDLIPAGSFICEYSGIIVTKKEAEMLSPQGANLIFPAAFPARWMEWGDMSSVCGEYGPPDSPLPELSFSIDVSRARNVGCYLSNSRSPNVFLQFVLFDHYNKSFPHLMVFALDNIPPLRELSIDYGWGNE